MTAVGCLPICQLPKHTRRSCKTNRRGGSCDWIAGAVVVAASIQQKQMKVTKPRARWSRACGNSYRPISFSVSEKGHRGQLPNESMATISLASGGLIRCTINMRATSGGDTRNGISEAGNCIFGMRGRRNMDVSPKGNPPWLRQAARCFVQSSRAKGGVEPHKVAFFLSCTCSNEVDPCPIGPQL